MATNNATPQAATLLVELLTEELPPKALAELAAAFAEKVTDGLLLDRLAQGKVLEGNLLATPRRLAILVPDVLASAEDISKEVDGPPITARPEAIAGFAKKQGVDPSALQQRKGPKGKVYFTRVTLKGATLDHSLAGIVAEAVKKLPIPKVMRWGAGEAQFVRPIHGLVMLHGTKVVPGEVLGMKAGNKTRGHRFLGKAEIRLAGAEGYEKQLLDEGKVLADFGKRKAEIEKQLLAAAKKQDANLGEYQALLDEVTALVEFPSVYMCEFEASFLEVPHECLILTMRQNQKYFPLFAHDGKLLSKFLVVSNMQVEDPRAIVSGNEKVVRPRLEDARFFFNQDRKVRLETRVPQLANVVYHNKLGSQLERVERIQLLAGKIARDIGADAEHAERAAWLSKADLLTGMVGEFPELQGLMGGYYAAHDSEPQPVVDAIRDQYRLKLDDADAEHLASLSLYLADRIHTLVGFFGVGELPTGEKDPFGLRRAALGVINAFELIGAARGFLNKSIPDVRDFVTHAATLFPANKLSSTTVDQVHDFILERCWNSLATVFDKKAVEAVLSQKPNLVEVNARVNAV